MNKIDRALHGPSWTEVVIGALLSMIIGILLGAGILIFKPAVAVKQLPAEPESGVVYYQEGSHNSVRMPEAQAKLAAFAQGHSVDITEEELNCLTAAPAPDAPAAPVRRKLPVPVEKPPEVPNYVFEPGPVNFRIRDGVFQLSTPVQVAVYGVGQTVVVQARGSLTKEGPVFVFQPETFFVGSCPLERIPWAEKWLTRQLLLPKPIPDDVAAAWPKLADATVDGSTLRLSMP